MGDGVFVSVPDLWADTNGDGMIGSGDILYSLVDLRAYLNGGNGPVPAFVPSESFTIVNGRVASLPGIMAVASLRDRKRARLRASSAKARVPDGPPTRPRAESQPLKNIFSS